MFRRATVWLAIALAACSNEAPRTSDLSDLFADRTAAWGLDQDPIDPLAGCMEDPAVCEPRHFTGGLAAGDVDGDGRPDLLLTRLGAHDLLFLNRGDHFEDASAAYGLDEVSAMSNGAALFDADLDGDLDLYVTVLGARDAPAPNDRHLYFEQVEGRFVEQGTERGLALHDGLARSGTGIAVGDYDGDGYPDLYLAEWRPSTGEHVFGLPHERLLHNRGAEAPGTFEDVTVEAGAALAHENCIETGLSCIAHSFAPAFVDLDGDGHQDLPVTADFGASRLLWNRGDGTFEDGTVTAGVGTAENAMGSAFGDYDGDGDLDWFVTSVFDDPERCAGGCGFGASGNRLYRNEGGRLFTDVTDEAGVRNGGFGWGASFVDIDDDSDLDLVMTGGFDLPFGPEDDAYAREPMHLFVNQGDGTFVERAADAGLREEGQGRALLALDVDQDGDQDLLVTRGGGGVTLYENSLDTGPHWLGVRALDASGTAPAYGAVIALRATRGGASQVRHVGPDAHYLSQAWPLAHFGLGRERSEVFEVEVRWPRGGQTVLRHLRAGTLVEIAADEP